MYVCVQTCVSMCVYGYICACGHVSTHVCVCRVHVHPCACVCVDGRAYEAEGEPIMRNQRMGTEISLVATLGSGDS